jgi:CRISPR-associated protein Csy2
MSQYLLLKKLDVQNANAIAGLTYGFPAITNFLGFAHALSRQLPKSLGIHLGGVAVISHQNIVHARQPKGWGDYVFALTRNPLTHQGNTAPINEEGRMNMQISLLIEIKGLKAGDLTTTDELLEQITQIIPRLRLAGGQITNIEKIELTLLCEEQKILRQLMPGFALIDRSEYLAEHFQTLKNNDKHACLFDAWCDFAQLKYKAEKMTTNQISNNDENSNQELLEINHKADWHYLKKPSSGYLVPINTGYCAISPVYDAGQVDKVRDVTVPAVFAESAYSVGEWKSVHGLTDIEFALWRYEHKYPWYVAKSPPFIEDNIEPDGFDANAEMTF